MLVKHMAADGHDMYLSWIADFGKMKLDITVENGLISTNLIKSFFDSLHHRDDRFEKTKIIGTLRINREFKVTLKLNSDMIFNVHSYQPEYPENSPVELDLILLI